MSTPNRPSDQWLERETAVLEAASVSIGLVTVANQVTLTSLPAGANYIGLATVDLGAAVLDDGESYIGLATVDVGSIPEINSLATVTQSGYSFKYFANANTSLATTFAVKGSAGILHTVTAGGVSNPTIGLFNHASTATNPVYIIKPGTSVQTYVFDEKLTNGITAEVSHGETSVLNISYS